MLGLAFAQVRLWKFRIVPARPHGIAHSPHRPSASSRTNARRRRAGCRAPRNANKVACPRLSASAATIRSPVAFRPLCRLVRQHQHRCQPVRPALGSLPMQRTRAPGLAILDPGLLCRVPYSSSGPARQEAYRPHERQRRARRRSGLARRSSKRQSLFRHARPSNGPSRLAAAIPDSSAVLPLPLRHGQRRGLDALAGRYPDHEFDAATARW